MRKFLAPLLLLLLCVGFYWKLTLTDQYTFLDSPDLANLDLPRLQFQATSWRHSHLPLWDPNHWAGQPFLGQVTGAAYPANWLLGIFPFDQGKLSLRLIHWYLVLIHFQAALFAYWLCRDWKRSRAASVLGGAVFALGGFLGTTDWPQILNGALWIPLIVMYLFRALRGRRALFSAAACGGLLGLIWLSGHHEVPIYATTVIGAVWLAALATRPRELALWKSAAAWALALGLISAVQVLPAQEYAPQAKRWVGLDFPVAWNEPIPYSIHQHYSWEASAIPGIVTPRTPVHVDPFIGCIAAALLFLGVAHRWKRVPQVRLLVLIGAAGLLLALANNSFVHGMLYAALPVFGKARVPARALAMFSFAVAPLAAYGIDALRQRSSPWLTRLLYTLAVSAALLFAASATGLRPVQAHDPLMMTALAALAGAALLGALRARTITHAAATAALTLVVIAEISNVAGAQLASRVNPKRAGYIDALFKHNDVASYLRAQPQPIRVEVADADIPYNFGDWHNIPMLGGFAASASSNLLEHERHLPRVQDLLAVNYYVGKTPPRPDLVLLTDTASGVNIYRNPSALPRAWTVHKATQVASYDQIRASINSAEFQPRTEALLLTAPPALETCGGNDEVEYQNSSNPNRVRVRVKMSCRGLLVLADTEFPGWEATVDGRKVEILSPYGALRGVVVDKGDHQVEWRYLPRSAVWGAGLSVLGIFFIGWTRTRPAAKNPRRG